MPVSEARKAARAIALLAHGSHVPDDLVVSYEGALPFVPNGVRNDFHSSDGCERCAEAKEMLDMVGLLAEDGTFKEPPAEKSAKQKIREATGRMEGMNNRKTLPNDPRAGRDRWAANIPEGLRNYDPVAAEKELRKLPKSPTPRRIPDADPTACGTLRGRSRHVKRGEKLCEPCRIVYNEYQADCRAKRQAAKKAAAERKAARVAQETAA